MNRLRLPLFRTPLLAAMALGSLCVHAQEIPTPTHIQVNTDQATTLANKDNWYLSSYSAVLFQDNPNPSTGVPLAFTNLQLINGGYSQPLGDFVSVYLEAGLNQTEQVNDSSWPQGYNVITGINYKLGNNWQFSTELRQLSWQKQLVDTQLGVAGTYHLTPRLALRASYDLSNNELHLNNRFNLMVGFNF